MATAHLIVNTRARRLEGGGPLLDALREVQRDNCRVHITRSLAELDDLAAMLAAERPPAIGLAGGDGSYMAGLTALARAYGDGPLPRVCLFPGGTACTVLRNYGYRGDPVRFVRRAAGMLVSSDPSTTAAPTLRVHDSTDAVRVGFIFGTGLVARFIEHYEARGAGGYADAARIVLRIFASSLVRGKTAARVLAPLPSRITVDGERKPAEAYSLVVAAAVRDLGLGMRVTYRAREDPSRVHLVASPLPPRALGPQLPLVLAGRKLLGAEHVDTLAARATVEFPRESAYVLDGDLFRAERVTVTAGPTLRLIVP